MPRFHPPDNRPRRGSEPHRHAVIRGLLLGISAVGALLPPHIVHAQGSAERGFAVFAIAGGCGCHTGPDGPVGAGGGTVPTPFGTFYGTNITADDATGTASGQTTRSPRHPRRRAPTAPLNRLRCRTTDTPE
jgi:hypothetical protein